MTSPTMKCYLVTRTDDKQVRASLAECGLEDLPEGDVLIRVAYSSLNYKDGLASQGQPGIVRQFPHVPGIDAAGRVVESRSEALAPGDAVLVTGFGLGAPSWGGLAEYIRVPAGWVVPLPAGLSLRESMIFGTAGFTAAIGIEILNERGIEPASGPIVVSGASGGVGSLAVAMLARLGYEVVASTGKADAHDFLRGLGAAEIVPRDSLEDRSSKPLLAARWAGAIDTVGGLTLATIVRSTRPHGCVTCCGMVGGNELPLTVFPFILRGVDLAGIDSAEYPLARRGPLWARMAGPWRPPQLEALVDRTVPLAGVDAPLADILAGRIRGRVVVEVAGDL